MFSLNRLLKTSLSSRATYLWKASVGVFAVVLLLSLAQAALFPLLDRDEPRFAEASREMLQSGNYIVPTFNGAPRYAKPPLIYWCQAAAFTLFGENAFAARLPSVLATAGTAVILLLWGTELAGDSVGLAAALAYAFCLQTIQQGRVATADALLVFFMTLTLYAGWRLLLLARYEGPQRSWTIWGLVLAFGFGAGFLAKGPEALLPFLPLAFCAGRYGVRVLFSLVATLALGLLLVALWAIPAYVRTGGAYWHEGLGHDVGDRMVTGFQGHGASTFGWYLLTLPLYLLTFWLSALPWSPLLIVQSKRLLGGGKMDEADTYLLLHVGLIFLVFSLMVTKLPHYTLPALPILTLFIIRWWKNAGLSPSWFTELGGVAGIVLFFGAIILSFTFPTPSPTGDLVRQAKVDFAPDTEVALVDFEEPNTVWELRKIVRGFVPTISRDEVPAFLQKPGPHAVLLTTKTWNNLPVPGDGMKVIHASGFNTARLKKVDLTLVINSP